MARLEVESEVQGTVWKHLVSVGDAVAAGDVLLIIESMKMEIPVAAPADGRVLELPAPCEAAVEEEQVVAVLESND